MSNNPNRGRFLVDLAGKWSIYWGPGPLPHGAEALGTVTRGHETGALLYFPASQGHMMGAAGGLISIPDNKVRAAIAAAQKGAGA